MIRFLRADDFLRHFVSQRVVTLAGQYGSGKSSLAVALSYLLLSGGIVRHCVSTMPVAWAVPPELCPPSNFVALLDEMGTEFDARSFGNQKQNKMRTSLLAFPRKLNIYLIVSSFISPDVSFRFIVVQRVFDLTGLFPLEIYRYGIENGEVKSAGWFGLWDRAWLWRRDAYNPSPKYGSEYVTDADDFSQTVELFSRSIRAARKVGQAPVSFFGRPSTVAAMSIWYRVGYDSAADIVSRPTYTDNPADISSAGHSPQTGDNALLGGQVSTGVSSGGISFPY